MWALKILIFARNIQQLNCVPSYHLECASVINNVEATAWPSIAGGGNSTCHFFVISFSTFSRKCFDSFKSQVHCQAAQLSKVGWIVLLKTIILNSNYIMGRSVPNAERIQWHNLSHLDARSVVKMTELGMIKIQWLKYLVYDVNIINVFRLCWNESTMEQ